MIELTHLQKVIGEDTLVDIEALTVAGGEVAAVIGSAGSDKSELIALLIGQSRPTSGTVRVCGMDPVRDWDRLSQQVGVLFTENGLYDRLSVRANLLFHCRMRGLTTARADEVLEEVGLADHATVPAGKLPQSLARRLAFGRAILHHPGVLLLMKPFEGCDAGSSALLTRLIRHWAGQGTAILILSGEVNGLAELCQSVHELEQGRIVRSYTPEKERRSDLPFKIPGRAEERVVLLNPPDILYASSEAERTYLHTVEGKVSTHFTLGELEERLARSGFFRAHRGYLVNLQRVKAVIPYTRDSFSLILDDPAKTEIPLSKTAAHELRELLGY